MIFPVLNFYAVYAVADDIDVARLDEVEVIVECSPKVVVAIYGDFPVVVAVLW
jgi:hypothetical protein